MASTNTALGKRYIFTTEALALADSAGANVVTVAGDTLPLNSDIDGNIFGITIECTEVCAGDGALDARLEGSIESTFANPVTVDASAGVDLDTTGLNTVSGTLSAVSNTWPFYRIVLFTDGTDTADASAYTLTTATLYRTPAAHRNSTPARSYA